MDKDDANVVCSVCLEPVEDDGERHKMTTCSHVFHRRCVTSWTLAQLMNGPRCPLCRTNIPELVDNNEREQVTADDSVYDVFAKQPGMSQVLNAVSQKTSEKQQEYINRLRAAKDNPADMEAILIDLLTPEMMVTMNKAFRATVGLPPHPRN